MLVYQRVVNQSDLETSALKKNMGRSDDQPPQACGYVHDKKTEYSNGVLPMLHDLCC